MAKISRTAYAEMYGPTVGDRLRLACGGQRFGCASEGVAARQ